MTERNPYIERAAEVLANSDGPMAAYPVFRSQAQALAAAGLLSSPEKDAAAEACVKIAQEGRWSINTTTLAQAREAGDALLAQRKPKELWAVAYHHSHWWVIACGKQDEIEHGPFTEAQARAVAAVLNALKVKP